MTQTNSSLLPSAADMSTRPDDAIVMLSAERMPLRLAAGDDRYVSVNDAELAHPIGPTGAADTAQGV